MERDPLRRVRAGRAAFARGGVAALVVGLLLGVGARADRVIWSDGETWSGKLYVGSGQEGLRFHDGRQLRLYPLDDVAAIDWQPVTQRMERAWRFLEAGKTAKEFTGASYPTLELGAVVTLRDGRSLAGHLQSTALLLEQGTEVRKLLLKTKLRGAEGEEVDAIRYPARVLLDGPAAARRACRLTLRGSSDPVTEFAVVFGSPATAAATVRREAAAVFVFDAEGTDPLPAVRTGGVIRVGWGGTAPTGVWQRVQAALGDVNDFFDGRRLLALATNAPDHELCQALVLVSREGQTTFGAARPLPWRLEVWRWRLAADGRNLLAARAVLFRGIRSRTESLPVVLLEPRLVCAELPPDWVLSLE